VKGSWLLPMDRPYSKGAAVGNSREKPGLAKMSAACRSVIYSPVNT